MTGTRRLLIATAGAVMVAGVAGWFRPVPGDVQPDTLPAEPWRIPASTALERSSAELASQAAGAPWIGASSAEAGADGAAAWSLLGVISDRVQPAALVQAAGKPDVLRIMPGAALPDGTLLVEVERGGVVFERDGCRGRRPLHAAGNGETPEIKDACAPAQGLQESSSP